MSWGKEKGREAGLGRMCSPHGASDEEISELSPLEVAQERITRVKEHWKEEDKEIVVSYIVDSDCWTNFKVNQNKIFKHVSVFCLVHCHLQTNIVIWKIANLLVLRKSAEQV